MTRIGVLREHMQRNGVAACIIPTADVHMSEYISDYYKFREYLSGFTGSAGTLVVTEKESGLWTDGRYYIQAENELLGTETVLFKASEPDCIKIHEYLRERVSDNECIGVDGRLFSKKQLDEITGKLGSIRINTTYDATEIWNKRPQAPGNKAFILDEKEIPSAYYYENKYKEYVT